MNTLQALRIARAGVALHWVQRCRDLLTITDNGKVVVAHCAVGWLYAACPEIDLFKLPVIRVLFAELPIYRRIGYGRTTYAMADAIARYNDSHTQAEVLALFDRAIEKRTSKLEVLPDWETMAKPNSFTVAAKGEVVYG